MYSRLDGASEGLLVAVIERPPFGSSSTDLGGSMQGSMEFFGYDFMVDEKMQPWLIEVGDAHGRLSDWKELVSSFL